MRSMAANSSGKDTCKNGSSVPADCATAKCKAMLTSSKPISTSLWVICLAFSRLCASRLNPWKNATNQLRLSGKLSTVSRR